MGNERLQYRQWQIPLQELVCDAQPDKINAQAHKVQGLIFERFQQLDKEDDSEAERQALKEALTIVQIIMGDHEGREENSRLSRNALIMPALNPQMCAIEQTTVRCT